MLAELVTAVLLAMSLVVTVVAAGDFDASADAALRQAKEIHVSTQRADGSRSGSAPVWFMYDGNAIYFSTLATSHKARRLRDGGPVYVAVGKKDGPAFEGRGALVDDPELIDRMAAHYRKKYWIAWLGFFVPNKNRVAAGKTVIVKVTPSEVAR
jgi:PPOX class probable F420-dependent enzyme